MTRFELTAAIRKANLKPTAVAVGLSIAAHWNDVTGMARIGAKQIGEEIGRKERQVRESINQLAEAGLITKVRTKREMVFKPGSNISAFRVNGPAKNRHSYNFNKHGLNPEWRQILPEYAHMTDEEIAAEFKKLTVAAEMSSKTGWTVEECLNTHPDWVQAQVSTVSLSGIIPDRTDGINGSRFAEYCPRSQSTEDDGERYVKDWELALTFKTGDFPPLH